MNLSHLIRTSVLALVVLPLAGAQSGDSSFLNPEGEEPRIYSVEEYDGSWITGDTNQDSRVDYALQLDEFGLKLYEVMDFNSDGLMDDFYFFQGGVLQREELDTNYDGEIDLWIHMHRGVYVRAYERDTDYDGIVDLIKDFDES